MRAAVALAEQGNFSRAAITIHTGQSALTKQISFLERYFGFDLFSRLNREVIPTAAGEAFVEQARLSLEYQDRAIQLVRAANAGMEHVLHIGKSPYTDPYFLSHLHSLRLPLFPNLGVQATTKLASELAHDLRAGSLDLAFLTGMPVSDPLNSIVVGEQPFFVAMLEEDPLALLYEIQCTDLERHSCILFERHVHPHLYDTLIRVARPASQPGRSLHHMMTAEGFKSDSSWPRRSRPNSVRRLANCEERITIRPLNCEVRLETRLTCRSDAREPAVSAFYRAFVRRLGKLSSGPLPVVSRVS